MKLYLSGPMSGIPDNNAPAFKLAAAHLRFQGYEVVVPHELDHNDRGSKTWGDFMGRDIKLIADGDFDGIVMIPYWEKSNGARVELLTMLLLNKKVFEFELDGTMQELERKDAKLLLKEAI